MNRADTSIGTPITTEQATRAVLRLLRTPILGDLERESPGRTFSRLMANDAELYEMLSSGERRLVEIARAIWRASDTEGASIGAIGGLDRTLRRQVLVILAYYFLGRDLPYEDMDPVKFRAMFGDKA